MGASTTAVLVKPPANAGTPSRAIAEPALAIATGFMLPADQRNQNVIAKITVRQSESDIRRTLEAAIKVASNPIA